MYLFVLNCNHLGLNGVGDCRFFLTVQQTNHTQISNPWQLNCIRALLHITIYILHVYKTKTNEMVCIVVSIKLKS